MHMFGSVFIHNLKPKNNILHGYSLTGIAPNPILRGHVYIYIASLWPMVAAVCAISYPTVLVDYPVDFSEQQPIITFIQDLYR